MEWNQIDWELHREWFGNRWDRLTEDDLDTIGGVREVLIEKLQGYYAMDKARAEVEIAAFLDSLS